MNDYISRQAALEEFKKACAVEVIEQHGWPHSEIRTCLTYGGIEKILNSVPSADAVEVRHGRWIFKTDRRVVDGYDWQCDQCKSWQRYTSNFCPRCGARMDGEQDG